MVNATRDLKENVISMINWFMVTQLVIIGKDDFQRETRISHVI
jgi:hypothetical protein